MTSVAADDRVTVDDCLARDPGRTLADDVRDGLARPLKELPPKHLYDAAGAELFDRICALPEYYPTRCERALLERHAEPIAESTGAGELVELGSGSAAKSRLLLRAMAAAGRLRRYVPVDVSAATLRGSAAALAREFPELAVHGLVGDIERHLRHVPPPHPGVRRVVAFLGGTIGNFPPAERRALLGDIAALLRDGDHLLLGADLVKDPAVIEAAYNDSAGVTAAFNRNMLHVVNRELAADFDPDAFDHVAFYDREREWVDMRLRSRREQTVTIRALGMQMRFAAGEDLRTEISAKFTPERLRDDLAAAGLAPVERFTDPDGLFTLVLARPDSR